MKRNIFVIGFVVGIAAAATAAIPGTETWDDAVAGTNGWTGNTTSAVVVNIDSGGNPNGYIASRRSGTFDIGALIDSDDSSDFTGDYAASGITGAAVDIDFQQGDFTDSWIRFRSGATVNGWRYSLGTAAPGWNSYSVSFDPTWSDGDAMNNGWIQEMAPGPSFADTMANVDTAEVRVAGSSSSLLVGIDNFQLVPEPSGVAAAVLAFFVLWVRAARTPSPTD